MSAIKIMYRPVQEVYHPIVFDESNYCCVGRLPRKEFSNEDATALSELVAFTSGANWLLKKGRGLTVGDIVHMGDNKYRFIWVKDQTQYSKDAIIAITKKVSAIRIKEETTDVRR